MAMICGKGASGSIRRLELTQIPLRSDAALAGGLAALVARDPRLAPHAERVGVLPLRLAEPGFAALARIVVSQQVSAKAADAIYRRLEGVIGSVTPDAYLSAGPEAWAAGGLSRPKQKTIAAIAEAVQNGTLDLDALSAADGSTAIEAMTAIWGVGRWTAEVYLLFACGHPDIFPARDLALQIAAQECLGLDARPGEAALIALAEDWSPLRSVAARLLWAAYGLDRGMAPPIPAG
jgi:DNA-3-methyladenine glycosylase II